MKVCIYSEKKAEEQQISWYRGCTGVSYFANNIRKEPLYMNKTYYTLTFTHEFEYSNDSVFFAYSVPYTYSDLLDDLMSIEVDPLKC
jgi:cytosolic carboxypeptidase protein 2/3